MYTLKIDKEKGDDEKPGWRKIKYKFVKAKDVPVPPSQAPTTCVMLE